METIDKVELKRFVSDCTSTGKCVETTIDLTHDQCIEIEDILSRCNDDTAKRKIRKMILDNKI